MTSSINYFQLMRKNINILLSPIMLLINCEDVQLISWISTIRQVLKISTNLAKKAVTPITQHTTESNYSGHDYINLSNGILNSLGLTQF